MSLTTKTCVSGGSKGIDYLACKISAEKGLTVEIMTFENQDVSIPEGLEHTRNILSPELLSEADKRIDVVAKLMGRDDEQGEVDEQGIPYIKYFQRNWWIARGADACFAITRIFKDGDVNKKSLGIIGGTAWAAEMFIQEYIKNNPEHELVPLFAYDMIPRQGKWYQAKRDVTWVPCENAPSIENYGRIAFIGAVEPESDGVEALNKLFEY